MSADPQETVIIRRHWNAPRSAEVSAESLWGIHLSNEPGGVCRALPRAMLSAYVWCDKVSSEGLGHVCREKSAPHDLLVCILPSDNPAALYERLLASARG